MTHPQPQYPYQPQPYIPSTSKWAVAALLCGIAGFPLLFPAFAAIICGHLALRDIGKGRASGKGLAVTGLVLGYGITVAFILWMKWQAFKHQR